MEPKKISFGFSKLSKKPNAIFNKAPPQNDENKIELITALEGQSIKLLHEKIDEPEKPLVIPLKESSKTSSALASLRARKAVLSGETVENVPKSENANSEANILENDTIEKRAARELLEEVHNNGKIEEQISTLSVPVKADELPLDGAAEPSLDDYDNIPINQFGFAMLRGMGWKDPPKEKSLKDLDGPIVRPKGMGLGADKIARQKPLLVPPEPNEVLEIRKGVFVKILAGKNKDLYGQIEGFDDHAGRVIIKLALGGNFESLNEFMVQPVSKKEYAQYAKVINSAKYEEYKKKENDQGQIIIKKENIKQEREPSPHTSRDSRKSRIADRRDSRDSEEESRQRNHYTNKNSDESYRSKYSDDVEYRSRSEKVYDRKHREEHRRISRSPSSTSSYSSEHRSKKKSSKSKKSKSKYRHSSSEDEKRHKKKTKKSKRHRSRSRGRR